MSEPVNEEFTNDDTTKNDASPRKRVRHRKRQLYDNVLKQMEFYFSDANLSKDRFLSDQVKQDPYVPLETFLKFNKIRSMTQDINDIAKAMKNSSLLELSEDRLKVKRRIPLIPYDAETRTLYVESIPVTATREWLQKVFSDYGTVAYISMPKFKHSDRIKGYGFIEFAKPEDAQKCLNYFTKVGAKLPTSISPEELSSIKTFSVDESQTNNSDSKAVKTEYEPPKKKKKNKEKKSAKGLELKLEQASDSEKKTDVETPTEEVKDISTPTEEAKTDIESKEEVSSQDENANQEGQRKKKTRKRTAKERNRAKHILNKSDNFKRALWGLQVLSKSEWKALRNKYLNLQRKYMKQVKNNLHNKRHAYSGIPEPAAPSSAELETGMDTGEIQGTKTVPPLERVPGVFVKEILPSPCLDVRATKRTVRSNIHALHVDAKEGQSEIIIRFDSAQAANEYCANSSNRARALSSIEEEEQWSRAEQSRSSRRPRGRARLMEKHAQAHHAHDLVPASPQPTHTHIRFDDEQN